MTLTTRKSAVAGVLAAISVLLGFTGLGHIAVPNVSGLAAIMVVLTTLVCAAAARIHIARRQARISRAG